MNHEKEEAASKNGMSRAALPPFAKGPSVFARTPRITKAAEMIDDPTVTHMAFMFQPLA